jgi:3-hydroxyisobutyrate dehydrogenase
MPKQIETMSRAVSPKPSVAIIGTGTMGSAVARRLLGAGVVTNVWNRDPKPALELAELGAVAFAKPGEAVAGANVVLTWLPTAAVVTEVMVERRVLAAMAPERTWVQMGTIGVEATERLESEVRSRRPDVRFVDAPVSGSRGPAEAGQLLVLASGPDSVEDTLAHVFDPIARRTLWLGPAGMGSKVKLVLNTWLAFEVEAAAEAAALAKRLGINPTALADAADGNPLASPLATAKMAKIQSGDDRPDFSLEWALKDLDLMRTSVNPHDAPIALAIADRWRGLVDQGFGDLDVSAAHHGLGNEDTAESQREA